MPDPVFPAARPGYDYDPYAGEDKAPFFLGTLIGKITGNPDGFISNYRELHILLAAVAKGIKVKTLGDIPDCPPLWIDEMQYWDTPCMVANVVKCQWPSVVVVAGAWFAKNADLLRLIGIA
jgi:hypothetical protein